MHLMSRTCVCARVRSLETLLTPAAAAATAAAALAGHYYGGIALGEKKKKGRTAAEIEEGKKAKDCKTQKRVGGRREAKKGEFLGRVFLSLTRLPSIFTAVLLVDLPSSSFSLPLFGSCVAKAPSSLFSLSAGCRCFQPCYTPVYT